MECQEAENSDGEWKEKPQYWLFPVKNDWHLEMCAGICSVITVGKKGSLKEFKESLGLLPFVC